MPIPVYSIAKPCTAAAALLTLDLEAPVGRYAPELPAHLAGLRLRELLAHRSGLDDYGPWPEYREAVRRREHPWPVRKVLERAVVGELGGFRYSNIGYLLVRLALETHHDATFFEVLDDLVLRPLGVVARPFAEPSDWDACDHPALDDTLRRYHPGWVYPGTFLAEPDDVARALAHIVRGDLGEHVAAQWRSSLPVDAPAGHPLSPQAGYGLGVMTHGEPVRVVAHGGGGPGFTLFAAASVDGARWHGEGVASEAEDLDLLRRCVAAVSP